MLYPRKPLVRTRVSARFIEDSFICRIFALLRCICNYCPLIPHQTSYRSVAIYLRIIHDFKISHLLQTY